MDIHQQIQAQIKQLEDTKTKIEREIDTLYKEIDHVEQDAIGVMSKVKMLVAAQLGRGAGMEAVMGEAYARAKRGGFKDAHDYIEHLKHSIEEARGAISKVNEIRANLESIDRDQANLDSSRSSWMQKAQELLR